MFIRCLVALCVVVGWQVESSPRRLAPVALEIANPFVHVSGIGELPDGRLIVTDATSPAIHLLDPKTGAAESVGTPGAGQGQYVQPGGVYSGPEGTLLILDRGLKRVLIVSPAGVVSGSYSIAIKGVTSASDADVDFERLDGSRLSYFAEQPDLSLIGGGGSAAQTVDLVRFNAATQTRTTVTALRIPQTQTMPGGDNVILSRQVIGSPADGFGVAPDGRVAVVRAQPYRVEWHTPSGLVTEGPVIDYQPVPMAEADKEAFREQAGSASVGMVGREQVSGGFGLRFADVKPAFAPNDIAVSPAGRVWVMRSKPFDAATVVYDVFDERGRRVDRVALPAGSRVVGFGRQSVFVRESRGDSRPALRKYEVK
jgi:streptogramin lyase